MKRYPYLRCSGDRNRICLLCDSPYLCKNPEEVNTFCSTCFSKARKRELCRVTANLKRAVKAKVPATLTIKQWLYILEHFNWQCAYCLEGKFEVLEHIVSIINGGGTTMFNCVPACTSCNSRKDGHKRDFIPQIAIDHARQQLDMIAEALGVKPGDLIVTDVDYQTLYGEKTTEEQVSGEDSKSDAA